MKHLFRLRPLGSEPEQLNRKWESDREGEGEVLTAKTGVLIRA
jgi:hypothetical protein